MAWFVTAVHNRLALQVIAWNGTGFGDGAETVFAFDGTAWRAEDVAA